MQLTSHKPRPPIKTRREERELFFWTASQILRLVGFTALVVYSIVSLIEGDIPGADMLLRSL
jgi:hypothetical protein